MLRALLFATVLAFAFPAFAFVTGQPDSGGRGAYTDQRSQPGAKDGGHSLHEWKKSLGLGGMRTFRGGSKSGPKSSGITSKSAPRDTRGDNHPDHRNSPPNN